MRIGIIAMTPDALAQILHAPESTICGDLAQTPIDTVQAALLLPKEYTVKGIGYDPCRACYCIYVESEYLPDVPDGRLITEVTPTYQRTYETGAVRIIKIEIRVPEDRHPWHPQPLPE